MILHENAISTAYQQPLFIIDNAFGRMIGYMIGIYRLLRSSASDNHGAAAATPALLEFVFNSDHKRFLVSRHEPSLSTLPLLRSVNLAIDILSAQQSLISHPISQMCETAAACPKMGAIMTLDGFDLQPATII